MSWHMPLVSSPIVVLSRGELRVVALTILRVTFLQNITSYTLDHWHFHTNILGYKMEVDGFLVVDDC